MGTKTVSLSDDAYHRLKRLKKGRESFSDVVLRLAGRDDLTRFVGSISPEFASDLRKATAAARDAFDTDMARRTD